MKPESQHECKSNNLKGKNLSRQNSRKQLKKPKSSKSNIARIQTHTTQNKQNPKLNHKPKS